MRDVTVVMAYYKQPVMLMRQLEQFTQYPQEVRDHLELVLVDDGSPEHPITFPTCFKPAFKLQVYRMDVDVRWNQDACRNLGVKHARHPWVLLTDLDHLIPERTMKVVLTRPLNERYAYKFTRINDVTFDNYKPHPNSWLLTRALYDQAGGYDERFAGYYGTDWDFRDRVVRTAQVIHQLPSPLIRVGREHTMDASMPRDFGRKSVEDAHAIQELKLQRERERQGPQHDRFPNHKVFSCP